MSDVYFVVDPQYSATRNRDRDDSGSYGQDYHQLDWVEMDAQQLEDFFNSNEMYQDKFGSFENYQNYMDEYMGVIDNFLQSRGQSLEIASGISSELGGSLTDWVIGELTSATDPQKLEDFGNEALLGNLQTSALNDKYDVGASTGDGYFIGEDGDLWLSYWNGQGYSNMKMQEIDTYASTGDIVKGIATVIAGAYAAGIPAAVAETGAITGAQAIQLANNVYNQYENVQDVEETTVTEEAPPEFTLDPSIIDEAGTIIDEFGNIIGTNFPPTFDTGGGGGEEAGAQAPQEEEVVVDVNASTVDEPTGLETGVDDPLVLEEDVTPISTYDIYGSSDDYTLARQIHELIINTEDENLQDAYISEWELYTGRTWNDEYLNEDPWENYEPEQNTMWEDADIPSEITEGSEISSESTTGTQEQPTEEGVTASDILDAAATINTILGDSADGTATGTATEGTGTADGGAGGGTGGGVGGGVGTGSGGLGGTGSGTGDGLGGSGMLAGGGEFKPYQPALDLFTVPTVAPLMIKTTDYTKELNDLMKRSLFEGVA